MSNQLCITVTLLDGRFHGRGDGGVPEWPPSPLRLFQALVAANGEAVGQGGEVDKALRWLENQPPPVIVAPQKKTGTPYRLSVPNNAMDIVGKAWCKDNYFGVDGKGKFFGKCDANPATHNTMKTVRPTLAIDEEGQYADSCTFHYLWQTTNDSPPIEGLDLATMRLFALGWGVDLAIAQASRLKEGEASQLVGEHWLPDASNNNAGTNLRTPSDGTFDALTKRYDSFLTRVSLVNKSGFTPVPPLTDFGIRAYRRSCEAQSRPSLTFELRNDDNTFFQYPQRKLIHLAGMVRHLAIEAMKKAPPREISNTAEWVDRYVAGHNRKDYQGEHRQFSYLPLPSIGHLHADQAIRRVMISAPVGDDNLLKHLAGRLAGQQLKPTKRTPIENPPTLILPDHQDKKVVPFYTRKANTWASVTPVILDGHVKWRKKKLEDGTTIKVSDHDAWIRKALKRSGIEQPCTFEWRAVPWFSKSLTAHKYDRNKKPAGYIRPDHLLSQTAVHLKLQFNDDLKVPGPLVIGAGRHCGLGLMAAYD